MGLKNTKGGEIVQVQGGHIIRATGLKDRHSKVLTAKGPRDRRVRLAAHTAIQFYDVQDRLGYDRPSKAVDWLMDKAKASIEKLAELPPWNPNSNHVNSTNSDNVGSSSKLMSLEGENTLGTSQFYAPQCVESQSLADNMRSFFPHEQNNQDLCLSLHTVHDPGSGGSENQAHLGHNQVNQHLFHGSGSMGFDGGWGHQQDMSRFTRLMGCDGGGGGRDGREGLMFNNPPTISTQAMLLSQQVGSTASAYSHQGSTLQSNYSPFARVFEDNQPNNHVNHSNNHYHQSILGIGHGSDSFMGFYIPSQVHGDLHGGASLSNRASSSSLSPDSSQH